MDRQPITWLLHGASDVAASSQPAVWRALGPFDRERHTLLHDHAAANRCFFSSSRFLMLASAITRTASCSLHSHTITTRRLVLGKPLPCLLDYVLALDLQTTVSENHTAGDGQ